MNKTVKLNSKSGRKISILIFESSQNPKFTIIESPGGTTVTAQFVADENEDLIEFCRKNDINYIAIDFSNNGTQIDQPISELRYSKRIRDLEATIDFVEKEYNSPIILLGSSMGGFVTLNVANYSQFIKGIILNCPAIKAHECIRDLMDPEEFKNWKEKNIANVFDMHFAYDYYEDLESHNAMQLIPTIKIPILIFHGTSDEVVPIEQSRETKKLNSDIDLVEIEGGYHRFGNQMKPGEWERKVEEFITQKVQFPSTS